MKGNSERCQWLESSLYVNFGSTGDTNVQIWEAQANKFLDKIEDFFSCSWQTRIIGAFIKSIQDQINWALSG